MQQPVATQPPKSNGMAIAAMVCGIVGCITPGVGIVAIILAIVAKKQIVRTGEGGSGMATAGLVLGIISTVIYAAYFVFMFWLISAIGGF